MSLSGMVFACTGKSDLTRAVLTKKIKDNGGTFASSITKKVTHLLCGEGFEGTDKYLKAKENGAVHIVSEAFLEACLKNKRKKVKEEDYTPNQEEADEGKEKEEQQEESEKEEEQEKQASATPSQRKKHEPREAKDHALKGWVVLICGRLSVSKTQIVDYVEKHGGSVTSSANLATHVLGSSKKAQVATEQGKAIIVDEEYMRNIVKEYKEEGGDEAVAASQTPVKPSPLKKKGGRKAKIIEKVISRKLYKGVPHFLVQYVGLNDSHNELLTQEDLINSGGEKAFKAFQQTYKKEIKKLDFNAFMATEIQEAASPRKASPKKKAKTSPKKKAVVKPSPQKNNKRKRVADVAEDEEEEKETPKKGVKGAQKKATPTKGRKPAAKRSLQLEESEEPKPKQTAKKRRRVAK